mgnify:CR=1 FL=1
MTYKTLRYDVSEGILTLSLDRPDQLNAFTVDMAKELVDAFGRASDDDAVGAIVVTGSGRGFCAGMDLSVDGNVFGLDESQQPTLTDVADRGDEEHILHGVRDEGGLVTLAIYECKKPVIAAINGACAGLGFAIATLADLRIVERQAKFSTAFSQRGLIAEHGVSWTLPRLIGSGNALDLLWSARKFNGEEAKDIGLAERLVETGEALSTAQDYVRNLAASAAPVSLQVMKSQVYRHLNMPLAEAMHETNDWMAQSLTKDDFREGVRSFIEKRPPNFSRVTV